MLQKSNGVGRYYVAMFRTYYLSQLIIFLGIYHMEIMPEKYKSEKLITAFVGKNLQTVETIYKSTNRQMTKSVVT